MAISRPKNDMACRRVPSHDKNRTMYAGYSPAFCAWEYTRTNAMIRTLRSLGLSAVYTVTVAASLLVVMTLGAFVREPQNWRLFGFQLRQELLILTHLPSGYFVDPLIWIAAGAALYLVALGNPPRRSLARTARAAVLLVCGFYALVLTEEFFWPALRQTMSPFDHPLLSAPPLLYCLLAPWLLGRQHRRNQAKATPP